MRTKILRPTRPGMLSNPSNWGSWRDLDKAIIPDGGATYGYSALENTNVGNLGRFAFENTGVPTFARIEDDFLHAVVSVELVRNDFWRLGTYMVEHPDGTTENVQGLSLTVSSRYPEFTEVSGGSSSGSMARLIDAFNGSKGLISSFGFVMVSSRSLGGDLERFLLDSFYLRVNYSIPPMPWKGSTFIQGVNMPQVIKQGSNRPFIQVGVTDATGEPLDMRGGKLILKATSSTGKVIEGEVTLEDPTTGKGFYEWKEGDTDSPGVYRVELISEWLDGSRVKIPHDRMMSFEVVPSLG